MTSKGQKSGFLGSSKRPHIRVIGFLSFVAFVTTFYVLGSLTSKGYISLIRQTEDFDYAEKGSFFFEYLNNSDLVEKTGYLVYSPSCRIPDTPPFHESIKQMYEKQKEVSCTSLPLLTSVSRTEGGHILRLHKQHFPRYNRGQEPTCCYNRIWRKDEKPSTKRPKADDTLNYGKCVAFHDDVTFSGDEEFVRVTCDVKKGKKVNTVYTNMHAFVGLKPQADTKMREAFEKMLKTGEQTLSVMILGFDSISRLNMIRTMPKTVEYLDKQGWYSLKGYNKVEDNTFPNLIAILSGMTVHQLRKTCWPTPQTYLDECPLIWKNFSQQGYITAYAEDEPEIGSFNYHKAGFTTSPTDYYLRPFMLAAQKSTKLKSHSGMTICLGPVSSADHILNYSLDFATSFSKYPNFSLFWLNGFSHNDLNTPTTMDDHVRSYFKSLKDTGALNSTMVIFLSDHGMRFGKIRETYIGFIEERLPFIYFWLPEWFKAAHPSKLENLMKNANRLTSPFDLHMTLADVLGVQTVAEACPKCVSLFKEVPWNRPCIDAGITDHWCTCSEYKTIPAETAPVRVIAKFVVDEINRILPNFTSSLQDGMRCSKLQAKRVLSMRSKIFTKTSGYQEFVILVETVPGNALFEATVSHKYTLKIVDTISRINSYSSQSQCMNHGFGKKYCHCEKGSETSTSKVNATTTAA